MFLLPRSGKKWRIQQSRLPPQSFTTKIQINFHFPMDNPIKQPKSKTPATP